MNATGEDLLALRPDYPTRPDRGCSDATRWYTAEPNVRLPDGTLMVYDYRTGPFMTKERAISSLELIRERIPNAHLVRVVTEYFSTPAGVA